MLLEARFRVFLASVVILCLLLGTYLCPPEIANNAIRYGGYYFSAFTVIVCIVGLFQLVRARGRALPTPRQLSVGVMLLIGGGWLLFIHAELGYKIVMDEYILASTAKNLSEVREVLVTSQLQEFEGRFYAIEGFVDKRPWFFPFIVSLIHELSGFRVENAFWLNAALGLGILGMAFLIGYRTAGNYGGALSVLLWVSLPLLAQNATGGGMEILNLFLLLSVVLVAIDYLKRPSREAEGFLSLLAVLLALTRYESAIFLLPVLAIIILGWIRVGRCFVSWGSIAAVVFLLPVLLQIKLYAGNASAWELTGDSSTAFHWEFVVNNLPHALNFFFNCDGMLANSILLSGVGSIALLCVFLLMRTESRRYWNEMPAGVVFAVFAPVLVAHLIVMIGFHAGRLDSPFVSRYALPFHLLLVWAPVLLLEYVGRKFARTWSVACLLAGAFIIGFTLPRNSKAAFSKRNFAVREQAWLETLSHHEIASSSLIIDRFTIPWSLRNWAAMDPVAAEGLVQSGAVNSVLGRYPAIYMVERLYYQNGQFVPILPYAEGLKRQFEMVTVAERSFRPFNLTRIRKIVGARPENYDRETD